MKRPVIGITARLLLDKIEKDGNTIGYERNNVPTDYVQAVYAAGGVPVMLPVICNDEIITEQIRGIDGLLIPGGIDLNPLIYGEEPIVKQGFVLEELDEFDIKCIKTAYRMKKPILGICRGHQVLNAAFGGTLYQDMSQCSESYVKHSQDGRRNYASHTVYFSEGSRLHKMFGNTIATNSYHHQAVKDVAPGFKVTAHAADNVIEAIEKEDELFVMSVQWHPEMMLPKNQSMLKIFNEFINEAGKAVR